MKSPYVAELQPSQVITSTFLVTHKDIRQKKTGEPYLSLTLTDRTGDLDAKMWDNAEEVLDTFEKDDFVRVRGLAQIHQNRMQLQIQKLQRADERTLDLSDYFPASKRNPEEMFQELCAMVAAFSDEKLRALATAFLEDQELMRLFKMAPAAKTMHHAYLGGLLEHVLSMAKIACGLAPHYNLDQDLLLTGVLLHDIGKIYELSYERSFSYSVEGHLLGHMAIGMRLLDDKARLIPDFPPKVKMLIEHMILSHHGSMEFGSPRLPIFPEALLLHHIDNLDSKMEAMRYSLERDRGLDGFLTGYNPALERQIFKKERYLNPPAAAQPSESPKTAQIREAVATASGPDKITEKPAPPQQRKPAPVSPFAEQLQKALKP